LSPEARRSSFLPQAPQSCFCFSPQQPPPGFPFLWISRAARPGFDFQWSRVRVEISRNRAAAVRDFSSVLGFSLPVSHTGAPPRDKVPRRRVRVCPFSVARVCAAAGRFFPSPCAAEAYSVVRPARAEASPPCSFTAGFPCERKRAAVTHCRRLWTLLPQLSVPADRACAAVCVESGSRRPENKLLGSSFCPFGSLFLRCKFFVDCGVDLCRNTSPCALELVDQIG
jgi:hypothetical protein